MHETSLLTQAFFFLAAAVFSVPISKKLGLGSVLGYLIAGVLIGPYGFGLVGDQVEDVMQFAQFGVIMLLFLIGLELRPTLLWSMRVPILGLGATQMLLTAAVGMCISLWFGLDWKPALAIGLILALSSTAMVLQTLQEKGLLKQQVGRYSFSVLLFQDIAVIPILAFLPLLSSEALLGENSTIVGTPVWQQVLIIVGVLLFLVFGGRFLLRPFFRFIISFKLRELFTAAALLLIISVTLLMELVGLSAALGTFLAGVVLANSEYRHELEAEISSFKGLLLGLFFLTVGSSIEFEIAINQPVMIFGIVALLVFSKAFILFILSQIFKMDKVASVLFTLALAQGGEFCFVLLGFAQQSNVLSVEIASPLVVAVALSMAVTPLLILIYDKILWPMFEHRLTEAANYDVIDDMQTPVILAGMGRFGQIAARVLKVKGYQVTILEYGAKQVELVRKYGAQAFYGAADRVDLLHSAGAEQAKLIVIAVDRHEVALKIIGLVKTHFPHLKIVARAAGRLEVHELEDAGADYVVRETFYSALVMAERCLVELGLPEKEAKRTVKIFKEHDEQQLKAMSELGGDEQNYISMAKKSVATLVELINADEQQIKLAKELVNTDEKINLPKPPQKNNT